jgi:arylsulfatase A-like enzyme
MSCRRSLISFAVAGLILTVWSACWGYGIKKHSHPTHPGRPPEDAPQRPAQPLGSATPKPQAKSAIRATKPAPDVDDPRDHHPEAKRGESPGMGLKTAARSGGRKVVHSEVAGPVPGENRDRTSPAHREASRSPGRATTQAVTVPAKPSALPSRPNIVVLLLDDQDDFTPYWEAMPRTAAMVQNGLRFRNAFSPTPICSPGRCTFLTGRLAHNTGVYTLSGPHGPAPFGRETGTEFAVGLSQLGYINGHFGKTWGSDSPTAGWQRWCAVGSNNIYTGYGYQVFDYTNGVGSVYTSGEYITDFLANSAINFLQRGVPSGQPFFICLAPTAPHLPLPPAARDAAYAKRRWGDRLPIRPNFDERDVRDKSSWLREQAFVRSEAVPYARFEYHKRMGSLMAVDDMMARIQSVLTAQGKWKNTIVFVTSDNGYNLGSHRLIHKMAPYEESIRVPLYVAGPGIASGEITRMVGLHDLAPTFLQLAGGQAPSYMDGKPLGPFLTSGSDSAVPDWRTVLLTEYDTGGVHPGFNPGGAMRAGWELDIPTYRSVRTATSKYIVWLETGEEEVYDLVNDPDELKNLTRVDPNGVGPLRDQLSAMLSSVRNCAGGGCP